MSPTGSRARRSFTVGSDVGTACSLAAVTGPLTAVGLLWLAPRLGPFDLLAAGACLMAGNAMLLHRLVRARVRGLLRQLDAERAVRTALDAASDLVLLVDAAGCIAFGSDSLRRILGWRPSDLLGAPLAGLVHAADLELLLHLLDGSAIARDAAQRPRLRLRTAEATWRVLEWAASPREGAAWPLPLIGRDVTEHIDLERELVRQARHDSLTGLPNRHALSQIADSVLQTASNERPAAILLIDLDRFKLINDSLGHAYGDQVLAEVGPRFGSVLRPSDTIARLGGDEFAILLPRATEAAARAVAGRLARELEAPFRVGGMDVHVDASIGIALSHGPGRDDVADVQTLLREADIAMYRAKAARLGVAVFDPDRDGTSSFRLARSAELRRAIVAQQLVLHYQPVVDVVAGRVVGVEALVRWRHPVRGLLTPAEFLPLAEETGLIVPLSRAVLQSAVAQAAGWARAGRPLVVAVNLSPGWLLHDAVPDVVAAALGAHDLDARLLRLEITESVVLTDRAETLPMLLRLRAMGVGLSLDDFGTGYSSMTHLRSLPVDELKVDRAFVHAMTTTPEDAVIVRAAIQLGHNLGMAVIAEGIEDAETLAEVVGCGCRLAQGYYFTPPVPADALTAWLDERFPGTWRASLAAPA